MNHCLKKNLPPQTIHHSLISLQIDYVVGSDVIGSDDVSPYSIPRQLGKFIELPRTEGVSTTAVVQRIVDTYDTFVRRRRRRSISGSLKDSSLHFISSFGEKDVTGWAARGLAHRNV